MSCLLQVSIHIFYMYGMSDHIKKKLIHIQWQIGTYQSHIKYIQGQIRLIHRLIHLVIVLLNLLFKSVTTRIPDWTRLADPSWSPVYSDVFNYHLKTFRLVLLLHFRLFNDTEALHFGNPINIYKFKRPITFTFNKMHLPNSAFIQCLCNVKDT